MATPASPLSHLFNSHAQEVKSTMFFGFDVCRRVVATRRRAYSLFSFRADSAFGEVSLQRADLAVAERPSFLSFIMPHVPELVYL